jgi:hypothetical protein
LENHDISDRVVYFYCLRDNAQPKHGDPEEILRSILKQLVCSFSEDRAYNPAKALYSKMKEVANKRGDKPRALTLEECEDLIMELTFEDPATIIIDALDECKSEERYKLLDTLDRILARPDNPTRIFVSSRDESDISRMFQLRPRIIIEAEKNQLDIRNYIDVEIQKAIKLGRLLNGKVEDELRTRIIQKLEQGAQGM